MNELFYLTVEFDKVNWVNRKQSEKKTVHKKEIFHSFGMFLISPQNDSRCYL